MPKTIGLLIWKRNAAPRIMNFSKLKSTPMVCMDEMQNILDDDEEALEKDGWWIRGIII